MLSSCTRGLHGGHTFERNKAKDHSESSEVTLAEGMTLFRHPLTSVSLDAVEDLV